MTTPTKLLNTTELADHLSVSASTVRRLVRDRQIPVVRVRTRVRYDPEAVVRALTDHNDTRVAGPAASP